MQEIPQEEGLLIDVAQRASMPMPRARKVAVVCGCIALVMAGYAMGSRQSISMRREAVIEKVGAILTQDDFKSLYATVLKTELTAAQRALIIEQITNNGATVTNANVKLLQTWYNAATKSNKIFANKLIIASVSSTSAKTVTEAPSTDTTSASVGAILTQDDFKSLYATVLKTELTAAQRALINEQITNNGATVTNANVKLLQTWYNAATKSNKIFANKLIIASVSSTSAKTGTDTTSASCPVTTYAAFGSLYSKETAGQTWARIEKIDSWVRGALPAVGAPLSVRKLRDCYKSTLTTVEQKHFTDNAVAHMKAGATR